MLTVNTMHQETALGFKRIRLQEASSYPLSLLSSLVDNKVFVRFIDFDFVQTPSWQALLEAFPDIHSKVLCCAVEEAEVFAVERNASAGEEGAV